MFKKTIALLLTAIMVMSFAAGCGSSGSTSNDSSSKQVTLKYLEFNASGGQEETLKSMIADFEKKNPGIKIDVEVVAYANYYTKLNTLLNAGSDAPDLFEVGYENFPEYASKGLLLDLTDTIARDTSFQPDSLKKLAYDAYKYDNKQMGICTDFSACVLFYNKDLFDAKNVAYPTADWTWKDELAAAQKLNDPAKGIWGTVSPLQAYEFYKTIAQNGGSFWGSDGKTLTINSKENVDALQWMLDKSSKYKVQPQFTSDLYTQPNADLSAFKAGKIAMFRSGTWNFGDFATNCKFKWDIALEPGNTQKAHHFFSNATVASKSTKYPEAAWKFMKYMAEDPFVISTRISKGWSVPVVNDDAIMDAYYKQTPPDSKKVVTETLDSLVLPPLGPIPDKWGDVQKILNDDLDKAKFGKLGAQQALDDAQQKIEKLVQ